MNVTAYRYWTAFNLDETSVSAAITGDHISLPPSLIHHQRNSPECRNFGTKTNRFYSVPSSESKWMIDQNYLPRSGTEEPVTLWQTESKTLPFLLRKERKVQRYSQSATKSFFLGAGAAAMPTINPPSVRGWEPESSEMHAYRHTIIAWSAVCRTAPQYSFLPTVNWPLVWWSHVGTGNLTWILQYHPFLFQWVVEIHSC